MRFRIHGRRKKQSRSSRPLRGMRVEEEVEIHEIVQSVTGDHLGADGWKGRLRVSAPLLGGKVPHRRHVPDRGVQVHVERRRERDPAVDDVFGEHLFCLDLHLALKGD